MVLGSSLLALFLNLFVPLGFSTVVIAHIMFCISFVVVTVKARLASLDPRLEQAAMDLYASEREAFRRITLPLVALGIAAAGLLAFSLSFDDFIITNFNSGSSPPSRSSCTCRRPANPGAGQRHRLGNVLHRVGDCSARATVEPPTQGSLMPFAHTAGDRARAALSHTRHEPFWLAHADRPDPRPSLEGVARADLVIVGAGFVGTVDGCAGQTAPPDLDVILLEGPDRGSASGRNGVSWPPRSPTGISTASNAGPTSSDSSTAWAWRTCAASSRRSRSSGSTATTGARANSAWSPRPTRSNTPPTMSSGRRVPTAPSVEWWDADRTQAEVHSHVSGRHPRPGRRYRRSRPSQLGLARVAEELGVRIHEHSGVGR